MEKEKLIARFNIKDYNKELENILQKKPFSKITKNLLSSMLYKIENSYDDYKKVKVDVPTKKEFIEELLTIIEEDCKTIEIVKPILNEADDVLEKKKSVVIQDENKIITYQNELFILEALYKLNKNKLNIEPIEEISNRALAYVLNKGEEINRSEVIRDFDGWSWNTTNNNFEDYNENLIYQILIYLIGYKNIIYNKKINIEELENFLKLKYKKTLVDKMLKIIKQISILQYVKTNSSEKQKLIENKQELKEEIELMDNKKKYIEDITNQKKKCIKEIEKIDKYINDDINLKKEYIKQNESLPQEERIFSLSDFSEKIQNKRDTLTKEIESLTEKLKPKNYIKVKTSLENNYEFINQLNIEQPNNLNFIDDLIKTLFKVLNEKIDKITIKNELIEEIYKLRYLKLINIYNKTNIGEKYKKQIEKLEKKLITTACNLKALAIFSKDTEENYKIYKNIFTTRIIDLDSVFIEIGKDEFIKIYDENSLEKKEKYSKFNDLTVKYNKKIKIFL